MTRETSPDIAAVGRQVRDKIVAALALSAVLPVTVMTYVVQNYVRPALDPGETVRFWGVHLLVFFTLLAMVSGGYVIWAVGRAVARIASLMGPSGAVSGTERQDELGRLVASVGAMLARMETQAMEIEALATRLTTVRRELEFAKTRLRAGDLMIAPTAIEAVPAVCAA